ncbi:MAG: 30S ribosomal protein S20 [Candidatus Latescibacter sp.]|nr:30S ribosomal protein S20 [Candidatus Latescibacter sp.]
MPHHIQFKKTLLQNEKLQLRNRAAKSRLNTIVKKVHAAQSKEDGEKALRDAVSLIDSTAHKGIIKKETAARKKSRLSKFVAGLK